MRSCRCAKRMVKRSWLKSWVPVCESADVLARDRPMPPLDVGDKVAIMTAGAYGMTMASNYNARPRPAEAVVDAAGERWRVSRRRETWDNLANSEV